MNKMMKCLAVLASVVVLGQGAITPTKDPNMNGEYMLARTPNQPNATWSTQFRDYPGGVEYFEVYAGPITSTYSEVFWTALPEVHLPPDLVQRFAGKGMAVVGFEADQVRKTPEGDVSVPINVAYNHHYGAQILSKGSRMEKVPRNPADPRTMRLSPEPGYAFIPVEHTPSASGLPTSLTFGYSNGGEFRKSYHGLPPPFAQVIDSPERIAVTPMQIDTWNRDEMNLTGSKFVPGPAPKWSYAPLSGPDATYSGLLECPLTTRIRKHITGGGWNDSVTTQILDCSASNAQCSGSLSNYTTAEECFTAARTLPGLIGLQIATSSGSSTILPPGCTVSFAGTNKASVYFNTAKSQACCGAGVDTIMGTQQSLVNLSLSLSESKGATITLEGPANGDWFGIGFNTLSMSNAPYAIIVDGSGKITEHVLGEHLAGVQINNSVTVVSNTVKAGVRQVVLQRPLKGMTPQHHTFDARDTTLDFITALGNTPTLAYHTDKTAATLYLWPSTPSPVCLCSVPAAPFGKGTGTIEYLPTGESIGFPFRCAPYESILGNRNPTCDIRTYVGGLSTCHHGWHLLDAEQEVPWQNQTLTYYMKYRLYFQEYDPSHHIQVFDITWSIGGDTGEYDVPQCAPGTPVEQCTHTITGTVTPGGTDLHFIAAHYHCHAPTCLSMEIYNNKTGELICKEEPYHGVGNDVSGQDKFDESGYIAQRVCLWGSSYFESPPLVSGVPLFIKAVTNSTYGHHGEMALPQMLLAHLPTKKTS
eukprot:m.336065 g.336065  ORF g.336065 m.336065 type:complete len:758 (-) comp17746_c0_seq1:59-2332(-)